MENKIDLKRIKKVYCIGIGGIGISAAARILNQMDIEVSGSEAINSEIVTQLKNEGINVVLGQEAKNVPTDTDLILYTVAIGQDHVERQKASELGVRQLSYPEILGQLMLDQVGIGISGTDGKTTTTAILGKIFMDASLDPTIVIGSKVSYLKGNSRLGDGKYFIFESDEYKKAFHNYNPKVAGITNIRADHLDVYKDLDDVKQAFLDYLLKIPEDGLVVINHDDKNTKDLTADLKLNKITYAIDSQADIIGVDLKYKNSRSEFSVIKDGETLGDISIALPGKYNVYNTLLAISIALYFGIDFGSIAKSLDGFSGVWRRFELLGHKNSVDIITDYAHTPEGLRQVIRAAKDLYGDGKVLFVFQPHQYSRTKHFFDDFVDAISTSKDIIISDIFYVAGRENPADFDVNSALLAEKSGAWYGGDLDFTQNMVNDKIDGYTAVMFIGAGNIYNLSKKMA